MGIDRFVSWKKKGPSFAQVKAVLQDYLGDVAVVVVDQGRLMAIIPGQPSYPFKSLRAYKKYAVAAEVHKSRWFEVFVTKKNIDVITRQTDEFTNVVADGFATLAARFWDGEEEER